MSHLRLAFASVCMIACHSATAAPGRDVAAPKPASPTSPPGSTSASRDMLALKPKPVVTKAGDTPWCWKKPHPLLETDYVLRYSAVQLERAVVAEVVAGAKASGIFREVGRVGAGLKTDEDAYVIAPAELDPRDLPANLHVVTQPYAAVAKAFDPGSSSAVYLISLRIDGYLEDPDGNDGLRATVEVRGVFDHKAVSRNYGTIDEYCVMSTADGKLAVSNRPGPRS